MTKLNVNVMAALSFGDWLLLRRRNIGISQLDIATAVGVSRQSVSKWEGSQSKPSLDPDQMLRFCVALKTDLATVAKAFRGEIATND